jgi:hypothetical protein
MSLKSLHNHASTSFFQKLLLLKSLFLFLFLIAASSIHAQNCDNITDGGSISGNESGCNNPTFDPSPILSTAPATGGSGDLEYLWMKTTGDPNSPFNTWQIIIGATGDSYDPGPITQTTYFGRCARRKGCSEFSGETNFVEKKVSCCSFNASLSPLNVGLCLSESIQFNLNAAGTNLSYAWSANAGSFNDSTVPNPVFTPPAGTGSYTVSVVIKNADCEEELSTTVSVGTPFSLNITANSNSININEPLQLNSTHTNPTSVTYAWSSNLGSFNNTAIANPVFTANASGNATIILEATEANGCTARDTIHIDIKSQVCDLTLIGIAEDATCTGKNDGSIDLTVSNSTGTLTYNWDQGIGNVEDPTALLPGTYNVTVTDGTGCSSTASFEVEANSTFSIQSVIETPKCAGDNNGQITINQVGGTAPFTYNWSNGLPNNNVVSNLVDGSYSVTVSDANGCSASLNAAITSPAPLSLSTHAIHPACTLTKGNATVTVSGGTANYTYQWSDAANQTTPTANNLDPGTYTVTVTDANGCTRTANATINTEGNANIELSASISNATCNKNDGAIDLSITGGQAPFSITWANGQGNNEDLNAVPAGNYSVTVTDAAGCTKSATFQINASATFSIESTVTRPTCFGGNNGQITLNTVGGTAPFTYNWMLSLPNSATVNNLTAGLYSVTATDANNCTATLDVIVANPDALNASITATQPNCNATTGSATVSVSGGTAPYTYQWNDPANQTTNIANNLAPGTYTVTITDANACSTTATVTINNAGSTFELNATITNATCNQSDGAIDLSITGGQAPYNISWNNGLGSVEDPSNVAAGLYTVTVTDAANCSKTGTFSVSENGAFTVTLNTTNPTCHGGNDGSISTAVTGGVAPFTYEWANGLGSNTGLTNLTAGTYSVTVTDNTGCKGIGTSTLIAPQALTLSITPSHADCNGPNGSAVVAVSGGTPGYTYRWSDATNQNTQSAVNLAPGAYTVTVTDANNCTNTASVTILDNQSVSFNITPENTSVCAGTTVQLTGSITDANYTYNWTASAGSFNNATLSNPTYTMMTPGVYQIIANISTQNGCTKSDTAQITVLETVSLSATSTKSNCSNNGTGSIDLTITGGGNNPSISWDNGIGNVEDPTGLSPGTYNVTVTNQNGCSATLSQTIESDTGLIVTITTSNVKCNGEENGSAFVNVSNGTAPYTYTWNNSLPNLNGFQNLAQGLYDVTVTDANGCMGIASAKVHSPDTLKVNAVIEIPDCNENNGRIRLEPSGGTPDYTYNWDAPINSTSQAVNGLAAGTYTYTVIDANGCIINGTAILNEKDNCDTCVVEGGIITTNDTTNICVKDGVADRITVNVTNQVGSHRKWIITDSQGNILEVSDHNVFDFDDADFGICLIWNLSYEGTINNLEAGQSISTITGCFDLSNSIQVIRNDCPSNPCADFEGSIVITSPATNNSYCAGTPISLTSTTSGDTTLQYQWQAAGGTFSNPTSANTTYTMMQAGTHAIVLRTSKANCVTLDTINIIITSGLNATVRAANSICQGDSTGQLITSLTGGTAPFTYNWNNGIGNVQNPTALPVGNYLLTVTDANGCTATASATISASAPINIVLNSNNALCNDKGSISATITGGVSPYTYQWSNGTTGSDQITDLDPGTYSLTVTDANGCQASSSTTINAGTAFDIEIISTATDVCLGEFINLGVNASDSTNSYQWTATGGTFDNANSNSPIYSMNTPGVYKIFLAVTNGQCTALDTLDVNIRSGVTFTMTSSNVGCVGDSTGSITIDIQTGQGPFTYAWDKGLGNVENPTNLPKGVYTVTITTNTNCSTTGSIEVFENPPLSIALNKTEESCGGANDGRIKAVVNGGMAPYQFAWSNGVINTDSLHNLSPGTYNVTVTDANNCQESGSITLNAGTPLSTSIKGVDTGCTGTGYATVTVTGGTAPYTYRWSDTNNQTTDTAFNLVPGTYTVTVADAGSCTAVETVTIGTSPALTCSVELIKPIETFNGIEGELGVIVTGGSGSYTYNWNNGGKDANITSLSTNNYIVTVTDEANCTCISSFRIENPVKLGDFVFEDSDSNGIQGATETGINGVPLQLSGITYYGEEVVLNTSSANNGMYMFSLQPGKYKLTVVDALGLRITTPNQGGDDNLDSDIDPATNMSDSITLNPIDTVLNLDIGLVIPGGCSNILDGGRIKGDENVCGPNANPSPITNTVLPSGGIGEIEYLWLRSHKKSYYPGDPDWSEIPNSNSPDYDPGIITETTYYIRCARRKGCNSYPGESNIVQKNVISGCFNRPEVRNLETKLVDNQIELTWDGKMPESNGNYIIERSKDGVNYTTLYNMESLPSPEMEHYRFMDKSPIIGENYYRIYTFHIDAETMYSNISMAKIKNTKRQKVAFYPNPVLNEIMVHFLEDLNETTQLQIVNPYGQILKVMEVDLSVKRLPVDLSDLPNGVYYLKFEHTILKHQGHKILKVDQY